MIDLAVLAAIAANNQQEGSEVFMRRTASEYHPTLHLVATRRRETFPEIEAKEFWAAYDQTISYSLVHATGFYNVYQSLAYIRDNRLPGDLVDCGCFLGGVSIFMKILMRDWGMNDRRVILFDTFTGPPVGSKDTIIGGQPFQWNEALVNHREDTEQNIKEVLGSLDGFQIVEGFVEDTLPNTIFGDLALLRLDTDFYESTKIEFEILYPKLVDGGVVIVDDYGYFQGSRRATDEYFASLDRPPLLNRIDQGVWAGVKPAQARA